MTTTAVASAFHRPPPAPAEKASERIRARLLASGQPFHANHNIAACIEHGELDELRAEVAARMQDLLKALVIDIDHDHNTSGTAQRVARMFVDEVFSGRYLGAPQVTAFPNVTRLNEMLIVGPVAVRSACSHHLCPIIGKVWIGILPDAASDLIGLSKYARLCEWVMSRPQIQEEAVVMLADELERRIQPAGLAVVMQADHACMQWRGVRDGDVTMTNSIMRGAFTDDAELRHEFLALRTRVAG